MSKTEYGLLWEKIDRALSPDGTWQDDMKLRDYAKMVLSKGQYMVFRKHMRRIINGGMITQPYETLRLDDFLREVFRRERNNF